MKANGGVSGAKRGHGLKEDHYFAFVTEMRGHAIPGLGLERRVLLHELMQGLGKFLVRTAPLCDGSKAADISAPALAAFASAAAGRIAAFSSLVKVAFAIMFPLLPNAEHHLAAENGRPRRIPKMAQRTDRKITLR